LHHDILWDNGAGSLPKHDKHTLNTIQNHEYVERKCSQRGFSHCPILRSNFTWQS